MSRILDLVNAVILVGRLLHHNKVRDTCWVWISPSPGKAPKTRWVTKKKIPYFLSCPQEPKNLNSSLAEPKIFLMHPHKFQENNEPDSFFRKFSVRIWSTKILNRCKCISPTDREISLSTHLYSELISNLYTQEKNFSISLDINLISHPCSKQTPRNIRNTSSSGIELHFKGILLGCKNLWKYCSSSKHRLNSLKHTQLP